MRPINVNLAPGGTLLVVSRRSPEDLLRGTAAPGRRPGPAAAESRDITALAAEHRGKGICALLDTAAVMAMTSAPELVRGEQAAQVP